MQNPKKKVTRFTSAYAQSFREFTVLTFWKERFTWLEALRGHLLGEMMLDEAVSFCVASR